MLKLSLLILLFLPLVVFAQVATEPTFPSSDEEVRILYDATKGSSALQGASKVYMHSGVILASATSTNWENVVGNWGQDDGVGEMTKVSGENDLWEITINPRGYFDVADGSNIYRMGMVFRNADGTKEGKNDTGQDIFVDFNSGEFSMIVESPTSNYSFYSTAETIPIIVETSESATIDILIDNASVSSSVNTTTLQHDHTAIIDGNVHTITISADNDSDLIEKTFSYTSLPTTIVESIPSNLKRGVNYNADNTSVTLVLEAPNKEFVYLLGDFNSWLLDSDYLMKMDGDLFWLTINGLTTGQEYVFQYLIDGELLIADPYTDKISDPWDDKNINEATYPNLLDYPDGKTQFRASVLQTGQQDFTWVSNDFIAPEKEDLMIYELLVRDFDTNHSYQSVIDRLDYLEDLGINALELMPINEYEGNAGWGYNPNFYFAPDKYYGPKDKLKELIDECHGRGIAVIVDMVFNHSYNSSPLVRMYWNQSTNRPSNDNPWYNEAHNFENNDAHWGTDFDHESSYTQRLIDSVNNYWLTEYKVDGFRFDFTKGFGNNFKSNSSDSWGSKYDEDRIRLLKRMADKVWEEDPNNYVIFEHLAENSEEQELANYGIMLWGNMNHTYRSLAKGNSSSLSSLYHVNRGWDQPNLIGYMESHDEERVAWDALKSYGLTTAIQRLKLNAAFFFTVPGPKMIWQFGERGYDEELNNNRLGEKPPHWEYLEDEDRKALFDVYSALVNLRTQTDYIDTDYFTWSSSTLDKWINITHPDVSITIVGNFAKQSSVTNGHFTENGTWYDYFSGETIEVTNFENQELALSAGDFKMYTSIPLDNYVEGNPALYITGIDDFSQSSVDIYPNPANEVVHVNGNLKAARIWNTLGRQMNQITLRDDNTIDISRLAEGVYVIETTDVSNNKQIKKFIKNNLR